MPFSKIKGSLKGIMETLDIPTGLQADEKVKATSPATDMPRISDSNIPDKPSAEERKAIQETIEKNQKIYETVFNATQRSEYPANLNIKDLYSAIMQHFQVPGNHDDGIISTTQDIQEKRDFLHEKIGVLIEKNIITLAEKEELLQQFNSMFTPVETTETQFTDIRKLVFG